VNAVIFGLDRFMLRKQLHIGKAKAERLVSDAMKDGLFTFHNGYVSVGSFRNKDIKIDKNGREYRSAIVKKVVFRLDDENGDEVTYTLCDLYKIINQILATFPIAAQERKDCLLQGEIFNRDAQSRTLTLKKLSRNVNMSVSSTRRIMSDLVDSGDLSKQSSVLFSIIGSEHKKQIQDSLKRIGRHSFTFQHGSLTYIIVPCSYSIANRDLSESFRHKIYGYHKMGSSPTSTHSTIPQLCGY
jgi:predicted transcriptional regulator